MSEELNKRLLIYVQNCLAHIFVSNSLQILHDQKTKLHNILLSRT